MKDIKIRKWAKDDFIYVKNVLRKSWKDAYKFIPQEDLDFYLEKTYSLKELENLFLSTNIICYVALIENEICGWLKLTININDKKFYLSSIYVLPEFQRYKIGSKFFDIAIQEATNNSFDEIYIGVMNKNEIALKWYKKLGFEFFKEEPFQMGKTIVSHLIGRKKL